jgi:hypothetical protein
MRVSVSVHPKDLKTRLDAAIKALCAWLKAKVSPTLYEMMEQGKKWSYPEFMLWPQVCLIVLVERLFLTCKKTPKEGLTLYINKIF